MRQLGIQVILIVGVLLVSWRLLASYGQKAQALRRLGLLALAAVAVWTILDPGVWTTWANRIGVGRGADLLLYGLVVAFFGFVVTTFRRFKDMETRYTRLARRMALTEAPPPPGPTGGTEETVPSLAPDDPGRVPEIPPAGDSTPIEPPTERE